VAEKRMFSKQIIDSDAFLEMPLSAQALYFHLSMRADDDGFVDNPRKIQRMVNASGDDLKLLTAKRYILTFDSGVIVIKHWRIHNTLRADRYKETVYLEEKSMLEVKENKAYTEKNKLIEYGIPNGNQMEPQYRLDKIRLDKDREDIVDVPTERTPILYQEIADMFNNICVSYPKLTKLSDARKKAVKARLNTYTIEDFKKLFTIAEESDFLKGKNERNWSATFDWLIKDSNMAKVLDGNYKNPSNKPKQQTKSNKFNNFDQRDYDFDELMKKKQLKQNGGN
jgi:hypothetical protein